MSTEPLVSSAPEVTPLPGHEVTWHSGRQHAARKLVAPSYGRRDFYMRRFLAFGDVAAVILALVVSLTATDHRSFSTHVIFGLIMLPAWIFVFKCYGLYERDFRRIAHSTVDEIPGIFHAVLIGTVLSWLYFQAAPSSKIPFITLLLFSTLTLGLAFAARAFTRAASGRVLAPERVLFVATGRATEMLAESLQSDLQCRAARRPHGRL